MKKNLILLSLLTFGLSLFAQLKVANNFGLALNVSNDGTTILIPDKGVEVFPVRARTVVLSCSTIDNKIKFVISKEASRSGLVTINQSDAPTVTSVAVKVPEVAVSSNVSSDVPENNSVSLNDIINGKVVAATNYTESVSSSYNPGTVSTATTTINTVNSVSSIVGEPIPLEYSGSRTLKIITLEGQGLELTGTTDSTISKNTIYVNKGTDLVIGVVEKKGNNQAIWPYGEIRKRINLDDTVCKVTDEDVQMMSASKTRSVKFKVEAVDYKILIKLDAGDLISLGYKGVSKSIDMPIGQSYVRVAYTDPQGVFHPTAFMAVHVTSQDRYISITANDLSKTFTINNW